LTSVITEMVSRVDCSVSHH